jgi:hypothetical protein
MVIHSRADWGAKPAESVTSRLPSSFKGIVVHWFGSPVAAKTHAGCPKLLRSVQAGHQAGEYNDIAYNLAVCPHGHCYELRGIRRQGGANGNTRTNQDFIAIVYMAGVGDPLTEPAEKALRELIHWAWGKGVGKIVKTHGSITGSACPGPPLTKWVKDKEYIVATPVKKPGLRVDVITAEYKLSDQLYSSTAVQARIKRSLNSGKKVRLEPSKKGT